MYSIGVIGNRLISFLILPFYTYFISNPSDYGYYDLCLNVCLTLLPITTLQMRESAFRFLLNNDNEQSKEKIVSFIIRSLLISFSVVVIASVFIYIYADVRFFVLAVIMLLSMTSALIAVFVRKFAHHLTFRISIQCLKTVLWVKLLILI